MSRGNPQSRSNRPKRKPYKKVLIVCEGKETEPNYFNNFKSQLRNSLINIECVHDDHTDPVGIVNDAINRIETSEREKDKIDIENGDSVWCVFDSDGNTPQQLTEAKALADIHGIQIAFSNPCFEIWFLLHFGNSSKPFNRAEDVKNELKSKQGMNNYNKNRCIYKFIEQNQPNAINNAEKLIKYHLKGATEQYSKDSNPSTSVHELVKFLKNLKN